MASLEYNLEQALLALLEANPALAAVMPRHSEYYADVEPAEGKDGNLQNPNLSVKCSKNGAYVQQTEFFKVAVEIPLWIDSDEQSDKQGIDDLFHQVESVMDQINLAQVIMLNPIFTALMDVEYFRERVTRRSEGDGRYERTYACEAIAAAKV